MSLSNFVPTYWSHAINRELERKCVFAEDCNRQYEGEVKKTGDAVRILGVGKPTILSSTDRKIVLPEPEDIADTSVLMPIEQIAYFTYQVDDISLRQRKGDLLDALSAETSEGLANTMDKYIAGLALSRDAFRLNPSPVKVTEANVLSIIDNGLMRLYRNNVMPNAKITVTVSPRFYFLLKAAYQKLDTDNSKLLENGRVGRYGNVIVKMSNNVATGSSGNDDNIMLRTDRAVAFANPLTHTEAFRPERAFSDAVKGFVLFDAKVVRPKEMVILNVFY